MSYLVDDLATTLIPSFLNGNILVKVCVRQNLGELERTIVVLTSNNRNNNNDDVHETAALATLSNQLAALLTGYVEFVDVAAISKVLHEYTSEAIEGHCPADMTCTSSLVDVTSAVPTVDVITSVGTIDKVIADSEVFLRQLLLPVFGILPAEPIARDWSVPPAIRHVLVSVNLLGMSTSLVDVMADGRRTQTLSDAMMV